MCRVSKSSSPVGIPRVSITEVFNCISHHRCLSYSLAAVEDERVASVDVGPPPPCCMQWTSAMSTWHAHPRKPSAHSPHWARDAQFTSPGRRCPLHTRGLPDTASGNDGQGWVHRGPVKPNAQRHVPARQTPPLRHVGRSLPHAARWAGDDDDAFGTRCAAGCGV